MWGICWDTGLRVYGFTAWLFMLLSLYGLFVMTPKNYNPHNLDLQNRTPKFRNPPFSTPQIKGVRLVPLGLYPKPLNPKPRAFWDPKKGPDKTIWVAVKIMVSVWIPIIMWHLIFRVLKKGQ